MVRASLNYLFILLFMISILFASAVYVFRYHLDFFIQPHTLQNQPTQAIFANYLFNDSTSMNIRRYNTDAQYCAVFFPGRSGGISHYERILFPIFTRSDFQVFALSYPGQDGNAGQLKLDSLLMQVEFALHDIDKHCLLKESVFIGRSLGATLAIYAAQKFQPKGLLLDGVSVNLATTIKVMLAKNTPTKAFSYLPLEYILKQNFEINLPLVGYLNKGGKAMLFQGTLDDITPLSILSKHLIKHPNLQLNVVEGANHSNVFLVAQPHYINSLTQFVK